MSCYFQAMFLSECSTVLILGNQEKALAVRSRVLEHLQSSESYDAKLVVSGLKETIQFDQASLEQPDSDTKKRIRFFSITPAGTTGECLSVLLIIIPGKIKEG